MKGRDGENANWGEGQGFCSLLNPENQENLRTKIHIEYAMHLLATETMSEDSRVSCNFTLEPGPLDFY